MDKKGNLNLTLFSFIVILMIIFVIMIGYYIFGTINDLKEDIKECKEQFPGESFCDEGGVDCGPQCKELDLDYFHSQGGGLFSTSTCTCKNSETNEVVRLY